MATTSVYIASDQDYDYSCSKCDERDLNAEAQHFCPECEHYLCDKCVKLHNGYHIKHTVYGRGDVQKWAGFFIDRCDQHGNKLEVLCDDHQELCCHVCVSLRHRQCSSIRHLPDLARGFLKTEEFKQLPAAMGKMRSRLAEFKNAVIKDQASLEDSCKNILAKIKALRKEINNILDQLEKKTVEQLDCMLKDLKKGMNDDIERCDHMHHQLKTMMEKLQQMSGEHKECSSYIGNRICQKLLIKADRMMHVHEIEAKPKQRLLFYPNTKIETFLKGVGNLGNTDKVQVYKCHSSKHISVDIQGDESDCFIDGMCEMPNGDFVIVECDTKRLMVLNSQYQVIQRVGLPGRPQHLCCTSGYKLVVAATDNIHFIKVSRWPMNITKVGNFPTDHFCSSVAHHQGKLYVGSHSALYQYTMDGTLVKKIYEDKSGDWTVHTCAVSPDGERIYVTNMSAHKLQTLDKSGQVLSTLEDPELKSPMGLCVSPSGHVFVCGQESHTVLQVDRDGTEKLATVAKEADGLHGPQSVCFSDQTSSLIVANIEVNNMLVFKLR